MFVSQSREALKVGPEAREGGRRPKAGAVFVFLRARAVDP